MLVYFFSPVGCTPCKMFMPGVEKLETGWNGKVKISRLNIYPNMPVTLKYMIITAPVLLLFAKGEAVVRLQGYHPSKMMLIELSSYLGG